MPRAKGGPKTRRRHKKTLKLAKGYVGGRRKTYRQARETVERGLTYAYRDRKQKKRDLRGLWIIRINAAARAHGLSYSRFTAGLKAGLVLTFLMGFTFLATQVIEYARIGFAPRDNAFTTIFFSLTGLHGAHVFVGLTLLLVATIRAFRGHYSPEHHHGVEIPGIYWHFVDVMWIVVYTTVYII